MEDDSSHATNKLGEINLIGWNEFHKINLGVTQTFLVV